MHKLTLAQLKNLLETKQISSVELTKLYLERCQQFNPDLNCFISINEDEALAKAAIADTERAQGTAGALTGLPIAHKDIFCTKGIKTSCGSKMLDNFIAPYDATIVAKMNAAGLVMLGKTNMDEFAMGSSNETSFYGAVKNPWDLDYVPGGSSGGSACAVAARLIPAATGTDTGGSIRQPASLCNITGLKPTYGRVSRYGMIAFASSLDQAGPMTQTAEDAALLLNVIAGCDPRDASSVDQPLEDYTARLHESLNGVRVGIATQHFADGLDGAVAQTIEEGIKVLEKQGAICQEITLPHTELAIPSYYVVALAECSSNLSRYDGVRFGYRCSEAKDLLEFYCRSRGEGFGKEVKRRVMLGTYVLSAGYYDAYYLKAQQIRHLIQDDFKTAFKTVDVIVSPTTTGTAFKLNEKINDPISMYLSDLYTVSVNLAGLPAVSIPAGFTKQLPVGMQLIGNYFEEARLLNIAHQFQQATDWHQQIPKAFQA